jgi:hypothetical protein
MAIRDDDDEGPLRVNIHLSKTDVTAIDDFRFYERIPTRAAAIRELLRRGLLYSSSTIEPNQPANHQRKN